MWLLLAAASAAAAAASSSLPPAATLLHLDCDAGHDGNAGTAPSAPVRTLARAQALVRGLRAAHAAAAAAGPITVHVTGTCGPARFTAADGGAGEASRVTYAAAPGAAAPPALSGGVPIPASWLAPVTDAGVLARLPSDAARAAVRQLDLRAHAAAIPDAGELVCKPYMGGEASILPGNLVPSGLEFFAPGSPAAGGDYAPLTLARYPNRISPPKQWSSGSTSNYTITPDAATAARLPLWARQLADDPGSIYVHYLGGLEWDDAHHRLGSIALPPPAPSPQPPPPPPGHSCSTPGNTSCACFESGFDYDGNDLQAPVAAASQPACCALCARTPGCKFYSFCPNGACAGGENMCYLKTSNAGRKAWPNRLSGPASPAPPAPPSPTLTLDPCPSHYNEPGYDALDSRGTYYAYNVLAELDSEGEYYINRTSGMLYVWLPSGAASPYWATAPWSSPVVSGERAPSAVAAARGAAALAAAAPPRSATDDPILGVVSVNDTLLDLDGAAFLSFEGLVVTFGREAGLRAVNTTGVVFDGGVIENVGSMVVNATGGSDLLLRGSTLRAGGNGAVFLYAGDRPTLTRSNHTVSNCSVSYSNRYMYCYVPMVAMGDCGNRVLGSELWGGPHQGVFMSGNYHELRNSSLHHLVQAASDSGAVYTGRDFTYQGSVIDGNAFRHIRSLVRWPPRRRKGSFAHSLPPPPPHTHHTTRTHARTRVPHAGRRGHGSPVLG
jgi:hypothetical protein